MKVLLLMPFAWMLLVAGHSAQAEDESLKYPPQGTYTNYTDENHAEPRRGAPPCRWREQTRRALQLNDSGSGQLTIRLDLTESRCGSYRHDDYSCTNTLHFAFDASGGFQTIMTRAVCEAAVTGERLRGTWETYSVGDQHFIALTYSDGLHLIYTNR